MTPLFRKLNLGEQREILILDAPAEVEPEISALEGVSVYRALDRMGPIAFALIFVTTRQRIEELAALLEGRLASDPVLWFAYPKSSSKRYRADFNRDTGWEPLGVLDLEPVRQVSVDDDWSALRFRQTKHIRTIGRDPRGAISETGKKRAEATRKRSSDGPAGTDSPGGKQASRK